MWVGRLPDRCTSRPSSRIGRVLRGGSGRCPVPHGLAHGLKCETSARADRDCAFRRSPRRDESHETQAFLRLAGSGAGGCRARRRGASRSGRERGDCCRRSVAVLVRSLSPRRTPRPAAAHRCGGRHQTASAVVLRQLRPRVASRLRARPFTDRALRRLRPDETPGCRASGCGARQAAENTGGASRWIGDAAPQSARRRPRHFNQLASGRGVKGHRGRGGP